MPSSTAAPADSLRGALEELAQRIRSTSTCSVSMDRGARALYATDASNYRQVPLAVIVPETQSDVVAALRVCHELEAPVLMRGGGTSLAGQTCNVAVLIDISKNLRRVIAVDAQQRLARVECGCVLDDLQREAGEHELFYTAVPSTHGWCTIGGMLGNNACGVHSLIGGRSIDHVESLKIATHDGEIHEVGATSEEELERICAGDDRRARIYRALRDLRDRHGDAIRRAYPDIPRLSSGFDLTWLLPEKGFHVGRSLIGTEGTCACILEATVKLYPRPKARGMCVIGYRDIGAAGDDVPEILRRYQPMGLEGMDRTLIDFMRSKSMHLGDLDLLPDGDAWLVVEVGADDREEAEDQAERIRAESLDRGGSIVGAETIASSDQERIWHVRESGLGATAHVRDRPDAWPGWEDSAVHPERLGDYLRILQDLYAEYGYRAALYGHFGQGLVHTRIPFDLRTAAGVAQYRSFVEEAARRCIALGGTISGEHGDGQARGELLRFMYDPEMLEAFRAFKRIWDPVNRLNPGKSIIPGRALDEDLRLGPAYDPPQLDTVFGYPTDGGSFPEAVLRCVGVGRCRDVRSGTMCPSYQVTLDEQHSTRGRARLLFEMLNGELREEGWRSEAVAEALDLCLSCKGCKDECPVDVDMATYKAEFLYHHYRGRLRPRQAYSMGLIDIWARLGSLMPRLINALTATPGLRRAVAWLAGIDGRRRIPRFATTTFRTWFARTHGTAAGSGDETRTVVFWPDTFSNHLDPAPARSAVRLLVDSGHRVVLAPKGLCCGRPLYDYGMLDRAKRLLHRTIDALGDHLVAGHPLVGVEPSCLAVFRDELPEMLPHDVMGQRLTRATRTLGEFLDERGWRPPMVGGRALVQGHCHQGAVMGSAADHRLLAAAGVAVDQPDSGCCGLAGSFGFERGHYEVSVACAERVLLPRVREAGDRHLLADGFSCRTQIEELSGRRPQHLAELLAAQLDPARG